MVNYFRDEVRTRSVKGLVREGPGAYEWMTRDEFDRRIFSDARYREAVRKEIEKDSGKELLRKDN